MKTSVADFISERLAELGMSAAEAGAKRDLASAAASIIPDPSFALFIPGRVEILGKHTDYAGGRSIVCAAEKGILLLARPRSDAVVHITRADTYESVTLPFSPDLQPTEGHWSNYSATVIRRVARNFPGHLKGIDLAIAADLPQAAGLSSSSAIVVAMFLALAHANKLRERTEYHQNIHNHEDLAGYLGTVENGQSFGPLIGDKGVGTFGGSQDHTAILCSRHNELSLYSYNPVRSEGTAPFPANHSLLIGVSGVVAEKTRAARDLYNRVSLRASEILRQWRDATHRTDATLAAAIRSSPDAPDQLRNIIRSHQQGGYSTQELLDRLDQFVEENEQIVPATIEALRQNNLPHLGELANRSQHLAETKLLNQTPETAFLCHSARALGATASSAFGAGFGGSVWAMITDEQAPAFTRAWRDQYQAKFPDASPRSDFFPTRPGLSATEIELP